jgi:hypothetical protein
MPLKAFISGVFVKLIAGFDDTMVHVPVIANLTKTKKGRISFAIGIFLAISLAVFLSFTLASLIKTLPYFRYISSVLILALAGVVYFDILTSKPRHKAEKKLKKMKKFRIERGLKLVALGFITAIATVIDDTIAYSSVFLTELSFAPFAIAGIFLATIAELIAVIYFSKKLQNIPYKKQITTIGLVVLALLIFAGIL